MGEEKTTDLINEFDDFFPNLGRTVYFYSRKLNRIVEGVVEGYADSEWKLVKVLEKHDDGQFTRHIVPWTKLTKTRKGAEESRHEEEQYKKNLEIVSSTNITNGSVVYLKQTIDSEDVIRDSEGNEIPYQVVAIYRSTGKAKLVNDYGEEVGTFPISQLVVTDREPLFHHSQYEVGTLVTWIEGDDVYTGRISVIHDSSVEVVDICKLMPADMKKRLPLYKVPDGRIHKPMPKIRVIIEEDNK